MSALEALSEALARTRRELVVETEADPQINAELAWHRESRAYLAEIAAQQLREAKEHADRERLGLASICVDCAELIPPKRLIAHPLAVRCIACQSAFEAL